MRTVLYGLGSLLLAGLLILMLRDLARRESLVAIALAIAVTTITLCVLGVAAYRRERR